MKIKFTLLNIEIQSEAQKKSPAEPKPQPSNPIINKIKISHIK